MKPKSKAPLGASLIVVSSFFYASYGIWTKLMGNFFDGYTATVFRSTLVVAILIIMAIKLKAFEPLKINKNWHWMLGMLIASVFTWGTLYYAILHAGVGISLSVAYAGIVIGMFLFGKLFVGEKFTKDKALSTVLGIAGLALIFSPSMHSFGLLSLLAALISGLSSAANGVFVKCIHYSTTQSAMALWATGIVANLLIVILFGKPWPSFAWHIQWLYLVIFSLASVIASWSFVRGLKLIDAGAAGILGLMEIVFGVLFGVILFHEKLGLLVILGIAAIIAAAAVPYIRDYNANQGTLN
jgi:drug/metabolite transporter (DMT)-like permease